MITTCVLLVLLFGASCLIYSAHSRHGLALFGENRLSGLAPNVRRVIRLAEEMAPTLRESAVIHISIADLFRLYRNSRILVGVLDEARMLETDDEEDYAVMHAQMVEAHARTIRLLHRALLERCANLFSGSAIQLYASAAVLAYGEEVLILTNMLELRNDVRANTLEGHC